MKQQHLILMAAIVFAGCSRTEDKPETNLDKTSIRLYNLGVTTGAYSALNSLMEKAVTNQNIITVAIVEYARTNTIGKQTLK